MLLDATKAEARANQRTEPLARDFDPVTSHLAAEQAHELQRDHQRRILAALQQHGPHGKDGIARLTRLDGVQVCRRLTELAADGRIVLTGNKVQSDTGRSEREWRATE